MLNKPTRKQHFVPEFFIKNFCNESGRVACCLLEKDVLEVVPKDPRSIGHKRDLYEYDKENNLNDIEKVLVEKDTFDSDIIKKFLNEIFKLNSNELYKYSNSLQIEELVKIMIIQILRVPCIVKDSRNIGLKISRSLLNKIFRSEEKAENFIKDNFQNINMERDLKEIGLNLLFKNEEFIDFLYEFIMENHGVVVYKSERLHFLSGEEPVIIDYFGEDITEEIGDLLFKNSNFYFPINPYCCLALIKIDEKDKIISHNNFILDNITYRKYEKITKLLVLNCRRYVFSDQIDTITYKMIQQVEEIKKKMNTFSDNLNGENKSIQDI